MIGDRCLRVAHHAFILFLVVATTAVLSAQTVVDPRFVEFSPSPDHSTNASDGTPLVQRYSLTVYVVGSSVAVDTMDLGKPTPSGGVIRVDFLPLLHSVPTPGVVFEARVTAVGPGGSTASSLSNGFSFQPACAPSLNATGQSIGSGGATGSVSVTAGAGCTWSATSNANWITLTGATGGTGNGSVPYSVAANTGAARSGTLTVAGLTYTVSQAAAACTYALVPTSQSVASAGGTGSTAVTAPTGCAWTGVSNHTSWLTVTSGASGNGAGTVAFSASANPTTSPRTGTITIGSQTFSVNQAAAACTYALVPTSQSVVASGGTGSTTVTTLAGCAWTGVSNHTSWLTVTSGASGNGAGTVAFSASANPTTSVRTGTITIGSQTFTVNQAAAACTYALAPTSQSVVASGGTGSTTVTTLAGCAWTGVSNHTSWLTVTSGASGSGAGTVAFSASANPTTSPRTGTITIGSQTFSVNQAAAACTYALVPTSQSVVASGGTGSTTVTTLAGCAWTGVSNHTSWLTVTSGASGNGAGTVAFSASANPTTSPRTGTITIGSQTFSVNQAAAACTYALVPTSQSVVAGGGTGSTAVTAPTGCAWTGVSNHTSWLTVTSGASGSGAGTVAFSASANPTTSPRTGTITIGSQTFSVNQAAAACTYALVPTSQSVASAGGTGSTTVTTLAGCAWTGVSNHTSWLTVTSGASGNGAGTVAFSASANPTTSPRTGTITIGSQTFSVNQAAAACTYALVPTSQSVVAGGGTGSTAVTAPTGCAWTGVSNHTSWLTVTSGASGSGAGTVAFSASANPTTSPRTGTITIGSQTFSVNQAAAACTYALVPTSQSVVAGGGTGSTAVTAPTGCAWTGVSNHTSWLTVTSGASGSGAGTVAFSASANPTTSPRTGTITIGSQTFSVNQAAAACTYALVPTSQSVVASGGTGSTTVTTLAGCAWTGVSNHTSWLTVTSGASGNGAGTVAFSASANPTTSPRTGTITIGSQTFSVNQAAAACTYALVPTSQSVVAGGGTGSTAVTAPTGCAWTGVSNHTSWLTVTSGASGSGAGTVAFSASANPTTSPRTGTITIGSQTFSVNQAAAACTYALVPTSQSVASAGGTGSTTVTTLAGCAWTGVSNHTSWLTVTSGASGNGAGTVAFSASANPTTSPRTGTITIGSQTFSVNQAAAACTYALVPTSQSVVAGGGTGSTAVTAPTGCAWTGVSNHTSWLTVTSGASGSGAGTVAFSASANPTTSPRTGTITIGSQTFSVNQAAAACTYALVPTSQSVVAGGGTGSTAVTAPTGCAWTGVSNHTSWLTVTSGASGSGAGTVAFSASANPTTSPRTGTITIGSQTFSVTQNATSCAFSISPTSMQQVPFAGGNGSSTVTTSDGCAWTATSDTSWITVTSGAQGTTSGQVTFTVAPSTATSQRLGSLTIAGRTFAVTQVGNSCSYVLTPPNRTIGGEGGTGSISVVTASGCAWTATTNQSWITVSGTGTSSGSASYTVSANTTGASRTGSISIGTQSFTVTQAAAGCTFALSSNSLSVGAVGGTGSTTVTSGAGCDWSAASNDSWITVTSGASGSGNGPVAFSVASNPNTSARTGTLTIATQTFTVSQTASACSYSLTPTSRAVGSAGGTTTTDVTTAPGCAWTAVSNATAWLAITNGTSGSGNATVSLSATTNTTTQVRVGTATIAGQTFTVTQNAASCTFTVSPTSMQQVPFAGANGSSTVTTSDGCAWTATSNTSWITVTSGAQGTTSGQVNFTVAPSTATSQRLGSLTIAGRTVAVTQVGNTCSYVLTPPNRTIGGEGGTGSITVVTASGCPWTATTSQAWISVSGTGTASGSASYTVSANTTGASRTGSISIGTQSFAITQGVATSAPAKPAVAKPSGLRVVVSGSE